MTELGAFPTAVSPPVDAADGPTVDGVSLREGDVLDGGDGPRVVVGTGHGPANAGVALFDPAERRERVVDPDSPALDATVARQALALARAVGDGQVTLWYASYEPRRDRFRCEWGQAPLGSPVVGFDGATTAGTRAGLRDRVTDAGGPPAGVASGGEKTTALVRLAERIGTSDRPAGVSPDPVALSTTDAPIPTGEEPRLTDGPGPAVQPGDRLVYWPGLEPPPEPLAAGTAALAEGRCLVVLDGTTLYDVAGGGRERVDRAALSERFDRARREGVVLRLLARECHVDPIGQPRTDSLHVYDASVGGERVALACGDRQPTTTPRLEHPLALPVECAPTLSALADSLQADCGPLAPCDDEATADLCARVADRATATAARRPDCEV